MARTDSTEIFDLITDVSSIEVTETFSKLMKSSADKDSL